MNFQPTRTCSLCAVVLFAASCTTTTAQVGTTGFSFLKLGVGSRALGMGEAYSATASDPSAMHYNPSGLTINPNAQILLVHREWFEDTRTEFIGATTTLGRIALGLAINATSIGEIEIRETPGAPLGTFTARNAAIGLSAAYSVNPRVSIGTTAKYIYEKILINEAAGVAFDFGALYTTPWSLRLAAVVHNIGSVRELQYESSKLPTTIRIGGSYERQLDGLDGAFVLATDVVSVSGEGSSHVNVGAEFNYRNSFAIRTGYQSGHEARSLSTGAGIRYGAFQLDYAFEPLRNDGFGSAHTLSVGIEFR